MALVDADGLPLTVQRKAPSAAFFRNDQHPMLFAWRPALREAREDVRQAWISAASRSIDALQNSGWLAGLVDSIVGQQVGTGLRLSARPNFDDLGWSQEQAAEWSRTVERRFQAWADDPTECDAAETMTLGQMAAAAVRCHFAYGEAVATLPLIDRRWSTTRTKVQLLPPTRLSQRTEKMLGLQQGVFRDRHGAPIGYLFKRENALGYEQDVQIPARDADGRPLVIHVFDGMPGQSRGISPFAPVLRVFRQYDQLADATLTASLIQTIFAASLSSSMGSKEAMEGLLTQDEQLSGEQVEQLMGLRQEWYENSKIDLGVHGRIAHLFPEDQLKFHGSEHPNTSYEPFAKGLLREIARCAGATYEDASGDYTSATYSSVRMATALVWGVVLYRRKVIPARFCQAAYEAWLDEDIAEGRTEFPGGYEAFLRKWSAATRAAWSGPPKPQADDLKSAKAHAEYKRMGVMTDEMICADLGTNVDDVYEQLAREKASRKRLGLDDAAGVADELGDRLAAEVN